MTLACGRNCFMEKKLYQKPWESCLEAGASRGNTGRAFPADVAVGLVIDPVALTVPDALFQTVAGAGLTLSCTDIDRCSITGNSQVIQVNKPLIDGSIQELGFENLKQACSWMELFGRFYFESVQEVIDGDFLYRWSLFPFFVRLFWLLLGRMDWIGDVIAVRKPQTVEKVIKSTCAGRIPNREP